MSDYVNYERSDAEVKAEAEVEKARIRAEQEKYEKRVEDRATRREHALVFVAIAGVASVILSVIWAFYLDLSNDGERKDQLRNDCQSAGGTWAKVDYDDYTCIPADSDIKPKDVYKDD